MPQIQHTTKPAAYQYDFDGECAPHRSPRHHYDTFTLGIFQWVPKAGGKGVKRGPVFHRVKGFTAQPEEAYEKARAVVAKYNAREAADQEAFRWARQNGHLA